jgi:hypothetical protein
MAGLAAALAHGHTAAPAVPAARAASNETLANTMAAAAPYGWTGGQTVCLDLLWTRQDATWSVAGFSIIPEPECPAGGIIWRCRGLIVTFETSEH